MTSSCRNLVELQHRQADRLGPRIAVRFKRYGLYHDLSYTDYHEAVLACASALVEAGIQAGDRVGLLSENRLEWLIADLAIMTAGAINVPPHAPLTARQVQYQLEDASCRWLFVSTAAQLEKVATVASELPALAGVVMFDSVPPFIARHGRLAVAKATDETESDQALMGLPMLALRVRSWQGFLQQGRGVLAKNLAELARREAALGRDDLATIMYTSGTTGNPKGVMLTHGNLLSNVEQILAAEPAAADEIQLNWLPFSHIYARTVDHYRSLGAGNVLALAESQETLVDNIRDIEPTCMNSVPRFYEKVLASCGCGEKLRDLFGRRLERLCSGGAPLPLAVAEAYHASGILMLQGYGLTESSPVISFNRKARHKLGTVGPPLPGVEVRIAADGEVLSRGPHIMKGYWKNPQATAETIRDGWLHTGDLGELDADGFLKITGRKKELLVLSNGKKVAPNQIEGLLLAEPCIDQVVVCGEGRNFLSALIVPNLANVKNELGPDCPMDTGDSFCRHPKVIAFFEKRIPPLLADLSSSEQVKKFALLPQPFSVAGDELTVSLKLRRNVISTKYREQIEQLYR